MSKSKLVTCVVIAHAFFSSNCQHMKFSAYPVFAWRSPIYYSLQLPIIRNIQVSMQSNDILRLSFQLLIPGLKIQLRKYCSQNIWPLFKVDNRESSISEHFLQLQIKFLKSPVNIRFHTSNSPQLFYKPFITSNFLAARRQPHHCIKNVEPLEKVRSQAASSAVHMLETQHF